MVEYFACTEDTRVRFAAGPYTPWRKMEAIKIRPEYRISQRDLMETYLRVSRARKTLGWHEVSDYIQIDKEYQR